MKPERVPSPLVYKLLEIWAAEGWEHYWKVPLERGRRR